MCSLRRIKAPLSELPRESGREVGRVSSRALAEPGGTAHVLPRGAGSSVGAQPRHRDLKFQKCDKAPAGPSAREASSCRVTADEVALKEVGRLIPAAERGAGQRPRNAQPGGAEPQPGPGQPPPTKGKAR